MSELLWRSAVEQARLVRDGDVSSRELVEESLRAIADLKALRLFRVVHR